MYAVNVLVVYVLIVGLEIRTVNGQDVGLISQLLATSLPNNGILSANQIGGIVDQGVDCFSNDTVTFNNGDWTLPNGVTVQSLFTDTLYSLGAPGRVTLYRTRSLTAEFEGIYTCRINDTNRREHTLYVGIYTQDNFVNGVPVIPSPPSFTLLTSLSEYPPMFSLTCVSTSFPPTNVTWLLDGEPIDINDDEDFQSSQTLISTATTTFSNVLTVLSNYSGEFTCQIANSRGSILSNYTVTEPSGPPELLNQNIDFLGSGNVNISWARPEGPVHGYLLFYSFSSDSGSEVVINVTSPSTTHAVLFSLEADRGSYDISILAFADLPTEQSDVLVLTLNVAGVPENITVSPASSTALNVSWNHPGENVVEYIIHYQPTGTGCPGIDGGMVTVSFPVSNLILSPLEEDTEYNVTITTVSEVAEGEPSEPITSMTLTDAPGSSPVNVAVVTTDPNTAFIFWQPLPCLGQNGPIISYTLQYTDLFVNQARMESGILNLNFTLGSGINVFRNISFQVAAVTSIGRGIFSAPVFDHLIGNPGAVGSLGVINRDITSIVLRWRPDVLIETVFSRDFTYNVTWGTIMSDLQQFRLIRTELNISSLQFEVPNLAPNTSYGFYVTPVSSFTSGSARVVSGLTTLFGPVTGLSVVEASGSSVNITWIPLVSFDVIFYEIYYNTSTANKTIRANITAESPLLVVTDLNNDRSYAFSIAAVVFGNRSEIRGPLSDIVQFSFSSDSNLTLILIIAFSSIGGILILIIVIVITVFFLNLLSRNLGPQLANMDKEDNIPLKLLGPEEREEVHIKATPTRGPPVITGNLSGDIHSVEGQEVVIRFMVQGNPKPSLKWKLDDQDLDWESSSFICRDGTIVFRRVEVEHSGAYKLSAVNANGSAEAGVRLIVYPDTEITRHPAESDAMTTLSVSLDDFGQYVAGLHANGNKKFRDQFKLLSSGEVAHSIKEVLVDDNRPYNRFQHIVVYDDNRIKLERIPRFLDCQHEYINACYVKGEGEKCRQFIATQGPLDHTVVDMWRLVWQEKAPVVVMLTKTSEDLRIKCSQYWPSKGSQHYGPFTVTLLQETPHCSYIVRELVVHYNTLANNFRSRLISPSGKTSIEYKEPFNNAKSSLRVTQYQYLDWPEHGMTDNLPSLLEMRDKIVSKFSFYPMVVHCSNGVGRTGAFIAMDMALEQSRTQGHIDVPAIVTDIRNQKMRMIQTLDQYMLIHDAVIENAICGDNHIHVNSLHAAVKSLEDTDGKTGQTGYEKQFNILEQVTVGPNNAVCSYAKQFPRKNREEFALPTNQWRVALKGESPDYINATFVLGYNNPRSFVVTQGPLRETRRDFWKMIYDQEITTVVMLSSTTEDEKEVCAQYWPSESNIEFGEFVILVKDAWSNDGFTRRILMVKEQKTNSLRRVVQYEVNGWGSDGVTPCNVLGVVNAINLVATTQRKTPNIPVLVHCSDGVGRSAMFCLSMASIERCKVEGMVDIFQLVKKMRSQLPGAICDKEQYKVVHNLVVAYLNVFSTSANFEHLEEKC